MVEFSFGSPGVCSAGYLATVSLVSTRRLTLRCSRLRPVTDYYYFTFLAWAEAAELGTLAGRDLQMRISSEKAQIIERILADYLDRPFTKSGDFREVAQTQKAVPVFEGWTAITFLRTDGTFFNLNTETKPGEITSETDERWQLSSLTYASEQHPLFRQLLPERPADAESCRFCTGAGWIDVRSLSPSPTRLLCGECGGVGWRRAAKAP